VTGGPPELVIVPAYNEAATLASLLAEVRRAAPELTVVVIDDGSSDATARIATGSGARVLRHPFNLGYGAALQTGYKYALDRGAERIVQMDADGQHLPEEIPSFSLRCAGTSATSSWARASSLRAATRWAPCARSDATSSGPSRGLPGSPSRIRPRASRP
jgi:glycosyltransferase involved in cell wall biosynthesis